MLTVALAIIIATLLGAGLLYALAWIEDRERML